MGKRLFLAAIALLALSCRGDGRSTNEADAVSAATARKGPAAQALLERYMPGAMADGTVKIAVLVNLRASDHSRQFIAGAVSEGRSMGFTVDAFVAGGDENRCIELAARIAQANYDGLVFAYGRQGFSNDVLRPFTHPVHAARSIQIVTFEAHPFEEGVHTTFQDDFALVRASLDMLLSHRPSEEGHPLRVIRIGANTGLSFLDRRAQAFGEYVRDGKIEEVHLISLDGLDNSHGAARERLAAILPHFPKGSIDALWIPHSEFAWGFVEALAAAGRQDIKLVSAGISNNDLRLMQRYPDIWLGSAAVDPKLAGKVNMRMIAARLAGEKLPETFSFGPQTVQAADLSRAVNMDNLPVMIPGWDDGRGLFDGYEWMGDLKTAAGRYVK